MHLYCRSTLASRSTVVHFATSWGTSAARLSGEPGHGSVADCARNFLASSVASIWFSQPAVLSTIGRGVPGGNHAPHQAVRSKPGTPASIMVGTDGAAAERTDGV